MTYTNWHNSQCAILLYSTPHNSFSPFNSSSTYLFQQYNISAYVPKVHECTHGYACVHDSNSNWKQIHKNVSVTTNLSLVLKQIYAVSQLLRLKCSNNHCVNMVLFVFRKIIFIYISQYEVIKHATGEIIRILITNARLNAGANQ
jgi:hypothetical protein